MDIKLKENILKRFDEIIGLASCIESIGGINMMRSREYGEFRASGISLLNKVFGVRSSFVREFESALEDRRHMYVMTGTGVLQAAQKEIEQGWLESVDGTASREVFGDFLNMAESLMEDKKNEASHIGAAVVAGGVLEEHLRKLCAKNDIETVNADGRALSVEAMNVALKKADVYDETERKNVTRLYALRTDAAHGKYESCSRGRSEDLIRGVRRFVEEHML